jgi:hypothetical protein
MNYEASPFESIESTHEFFRLLSEIVSDTKKDIHADVERESNGKPTRRTDALRLAAYHLEKLELHVTKSRRILNDLRSIRRLLLEERAPKPTGLPVAPKVSTPAPPVAPFAVKMATQVTKPDARPHSAAVA